MGSRLRHSLGGGAGPTVPSCLTYILGLLASTSVLSSCLLCHLSVEQGIKSPCPFCSLCSEILTFSLPAFLYLASLPSFFPLFLLFPFSVAFALLPLALAVSIKPVAYVACPLQPLPPLAPGDEGGGSSWVTG